jgi:hypothetical protein
MRHDERQKRGDGTKINGACIPSCAVTAEESKGEKKEEKRKRKSTLMNVASPARSASERAPPSLPRGRLERGEERMELRSFGKPRNDIATTIRRRSSQNRNRNTEEEEEENSEI